MDNLFKKISTFIVDKRKIFFIIYIAASIFCVIANGWTKVNNNITDYLPQDTETKIGLDIMDEEFTTFSTASIMLDNVSLDRAEAVNEKLEEIDGIKESAFDGDEDFNNGAALFTITFNGERDENAMKEIKELLAPYDFYVSSEVGNSRADSIAKELQVIMVIVAVIILAVLLFTSHTYMEIPVLVITFGSAAILNKGTNFIFGTISFVSNSVAVVLQLALAIDYALILCHRYTEEREQLNQREAVITALSKAIPEISGSSMTTLSGLAAMCFMQFRIGADMGLVLIKSIIFSLLSVFTLMPGLLMLFGNLIDRTHHKSFVPKIDKWGKIVVKLRYITPVLFVAVVVFAFVFSSKCPYAYSENTVTSLIESDNKKAENLIDENFERSTTIAVITPVGEYEKESSLIHDIENLEETDSVTGLANVEAKDGYMLTDRINPRQFAEILDVDVEVGKLLYGMHAAENEEFGRIIGDIDNYHMMVMDAFLFLHEKVDEGYVTLDDDKQEELDDTYVDLIDARKQLLGENYDRIVVQAYIPEEGDEAYAFVDKLQEMVESYFDEPIYIVGNPTSNYELSKSFATDNILISVLSILFVIAVLIIMFRSFGTAALLIIVIQGSIWINFSFPYLQSEPLFFLSYLVVSSIQMGANIDYAIVITNRFDELKETMPLKDAAIEALSGSFPTIVTSGTILMAAGFLIGILSTDPTISSIGLSLGRGTATSLVLVMLILPQLLILSDSIIKKTKIERLEENEA